jgi:hypothetical protein
MLGVLAAVKSGAGLAPLPMLLTLCARNRGQGWRGTRVFQLEQRGNA